MARLHNNILRCDTIILGFDLIKHYYLKFSGLLCSPTQKEIRIWLGKTSTVWHFLACFACLHKNILGFNLVKKYYLTFLGLHLNIGNSVLFLKKFGSLCSQKQVKTCAIWFFWHALFAYTTINTLQFKANQYRYANYT